MQTLEPVPKIAAGPARPVRYSADEVSPTHQDPRWLLAQRIARSGSLGRSRLLADFLLYVVDRHIHGRADEMTEQQIGVLVFGRSEGYDSNEDNIVRSYARNLRKRIDDYFETEGSQEPMRLEIPRGGYAPIFSNRSVETQPQVTHVEDPETPDLAPALAAELSALIFPDPTFPNPEALRPARPRLVQAAKTHSRALLALCLGLLLGVALMNLRPARLFKRLLPASPESISGVLWSELFSSERDTFIVPSDDGLVIMQGLTERPVPLDAYINGSYRTDLKAGNVPGTPDLLKLGARRFTSVVDLGFVARLAQLKEVVPARMMIRYARDLRMEDLRAGNAVLIGSVEANPWIELFEPRMNFRFSIHPAPELSGLSNSHPRPGESSIYGTPGRDHTYGLIAYVPNLAATGHVLIVAGLNTAGTEAAASFLLTPSLMMPVLQHARRPDGSLQPFELLIGAGSVATNASTPQLAVERIGTP